MSRPIGNKNKKLKQFCIYGHDVFICGRDKQSRCIRCLKKNNKGHKKGKKNAQFCPKGHDTFVVGRTKSRGCKECSREDNRRRRKEIKEGLRSVNPVKHNQFCTFGHDTLVTGRTTDGHCRLCVNDKNRKWQKIHIKSVLEYQKQYQEEHKEKINAHSKNRREIDLNFRLAGVLRSRLSRSIRNNTKVGSFVRDLGCTIEFLKEYIESLFYGDMTWNNYGSYWEIDHIDELHTFDLTDREQFLKAVNYKNLQPLTIPDHKKKSAVNKRAIKNR